MENISAHITYDEATNSPTAKAKGISNEPTLQHLKAMVLVANKCFEPVRKFANVPLKINSFYRAPDLNKAIGGAVDKLGNPRSQHCKGEAIDFNGNGKIKNSALFQFIKTNLDFDQIICEHPVNGEPTWVHVSYKEGANRMQLLTVDKESPHGRAYKKGDCNECNA